MRLPLTFAYYRSRGGVSRGTLKDPRCIPTITLCSLEEDLI
jgi:hypothetical protein